MCRQTTDISSFFLHVSILFCDNAVLMVRLGFGTKTDWSEEKTMLYLEISDVVATETAGNCPRYVG